MGFFCLFVFKFTFSVRKTQSCVWREHLCSLCVHAMCTRCVRLFSFAFFGLFSERWRNLLTGNVSGGGQWRFWDRHKRHVSERRREKEGLFHVTLHSTKAQARGGTRRDMRPPRHSPLPPFQCPFSPPSHPIQPLYLPSTKPPQIFYQERSCWNSFYASVLCKEAQVHTNVHTQCHRAIGFKYCVAVLGLSLFFAKETCLETLMPRDRNTCLYTHSLVPLASLLYLLSLGPIHLTFH